MFLKHNSKSNHGNIVHDFSLYLLPGIFLLIDIEGNLSIMDARTCIPQRDNVNVRSQMNCKKNYIEITSTRWATQFGNGFYKKYKMETQYY